MTQVGIGGLRGPIAGLDRCESFLRGIGDTLEALDGFGDAPVEVSLCDKNLVVDGLDVAVLQVDLSLAGGTVSAAASIRPIEGMHAFVAAFADKADGRLSVAWHDGWPILSIGAPSPVDTGSGAGGEPRPVEGAQ